MSIYYLRPVAKGVCAECGKEYPALVEYVYLTEKGLVHPACYPDAPAPVTVVAPPAPRKPKPKAKPKAKRPAAKPVRRAAPAVKASPPKVRELPTKPRPHSENTGSKVCRNCWTVHPPETKCRA